MFNKGIENQLLLRLAIGCGCHVVGACDHCLFLFLASCNYFSDDVRGESCEELQVLLVRARNRHEFGWGSWYGVLGDFISEWAKSDRRVGKHCLLVDTLFSQLVFTSSNR